MVYWEALSSIMRSLRLPFEPGKVVFEEISSPINSMIMRKITLTIRNIFFFVFILKSFSSNLR